MPCFVLVQIKQLEHLLQHCPDCGARPGRDKPTNRPRNIKWKKTGTNLTAHFTCSCRGSNNKNSWAAQKFIGDSHLRVGNLAVVAAAQLAPIAFVDLAAFCKASGIAFVSKITFQRLSSNFVWPAVQDYYEKQKPELKEKNDLSMDGTYDSPGHSAFYCAETCLDINSKLVVDYSITKKDEVGGVSNRMELVCKRLRERGIRYFFDPWHHLKTLRRKIRKIRNKMKDRRNMNTQEEKERLEKFDNLSRRLYTHVYSAVEQAKGDPVVLKEIVLSFFLHVTGCHSWESKNVAFLIFSLKHPFHWQKTGFDPRSTCLSKETFSKVLKCVHESDAMTLAFDPTSTPYIELLKIATSKTFLEDLQKLRHGNVTAHIESFHSICIHYRPKRKFYNLKGFIGRTMLAAISYNANVKAEISGERKVVSEYRYYSKSKGTFTKKFKKSPPVDTWKTEIVKLVIEKKLHHELPEAEGEDYLDDGIYEEPIDEVDYVSQFDADYLDDSDDLYSEDLVEEEEDIESEPHEDIEIDSQDSSVSTSSENSYQEPKRTDYKIVFGESDEDEEETEGSMEYED
uniref:Uncharacterized protein n=1 Tax=Acrobeloides nanus TaxID=290746 RepID=A0A914ECZ7_9BILA